MPVPWSHSLCALTATCGRPCENGGHCLPEGFCWCEKGFYGNTCEFSTYGFQSLYMFLGKITRNNNDRCCIVNYRMVPISYRGCPLVIRVGPLSHKQIITLFTKNPSTGACSICCPTVPIVLHACRHTNLATSR